MTESLNKTIDAEVKATKKGTRKKPDYPQRRYGIEVDRVEDVGTMIMAEGVYPRRVMTTEEYASLPQEVRDKASADLRHIFENSEEFFKKNLKDVLREQLESGFPICYADSVSGEIVKRYPDRRIFITRMDMKTFKSTETFLRMATPEDDIGIYD